MAKNKSNTATLEKPQATLGSADHLEEQELTTEQQDILAENSAVVDEMLATPAPIAPSTVLIEVPVAPFDPSAHRSRLVTVRLSQRQADALKCVQLGLTNQHARLATGGHVDKQAQVIQWILEGIADAIEKASPAEAA